MIRHLAIVVTVVFVLLLIPVITTPGSQPIDIKCVAELVTFAILIAIPSALIGEFLFKSFRGRFSRVSVEVRSASAASSALVGPVVGFVCGFVGCLVFFPVGGGEMLFVIAIASSLSGLIALIFGAGVGQGIGQS